MIVKRGSLVSHPGINAWGTGKVIAVADFKATILFSDGVTRKIASSHYAILTPADPASFVAMVVPDPVVKTPRAASVKRKLKSVAVVTA